MVSHELRTPLSVVLNWSQMLLRPGLDPSRVKSGLERIERNARMLARLIEDLLDVSRIISGKLMVEREPLDVCVPVQQAVEALRGAAERKNVGISFTVSPGLRPVLGCPWRVQQIATDLIENAIKFSEPTQTVAVALWPEPGAVVLQVQDRGAGVAQELLPPATP